VVLTRYRVVRERFDNGGFGVHDFVRFELAAVLSVLGKGSRGWGLLTLCWLDLLRYSFVPLCLSCLLILPL
jgi:hypothetical protein